MEYLITEFVTAICLRRPPNQGRFEKYLLLPTLRYFMCDVTCLGVEERTLYTLVHFAQCRLYSDTFSSILVEQMCATVSARAHV